MKKIVKALFLGALVVYGALCCVGCSQTAEEYELDSTEKELVVGEDTDSSRSIFSDKTRIGHGTATPSGRSHRGRFGRR